MTKFEIYIVIMIAICIVSEITIGCYIAKLFADIEAMRHEYLDLLRDVYTDRKECLDEWGASIDGWKKSLSQWDDTIHIFMDYVHSDMREVT